MSQGLEDTFLPRRCNVEVIYAAFDYHWGILDEKTDKQLFDDALPDDVCHVIREWENHTSLWSAQKEDADEMDRGGGASIPAQC